MIVELIGCTSAGKSTQLNSILQICNEMNIKAINSDNFILGKIHLNRIENYFIRTLVIDLMSILTCLFVSRKNFDLYSLIFKIVRDSPSTVRFLEKLNIIRNTFKKIGIYEIARRYGSVDEIILMDEGTLHTANYLFVNVAVAPKSDYFPNFVSLIPLADVVIYLQENDEILIKRTLARGHKRIHQLSRTIVERFIKHAVATFDELAQIPIVKSRLLVVNSAQRITNFQSNQYFSQQVTIQKILQSSLDLINSSSIFQKN